MKIEVAVITAPQKGKAVTEDAFIVLKKDHGSFFAIVVDGHGPGGEFNIQTAELAEYIAQNLASLIRGEPVVPSWTSYFDTVQKDVAQAYGDLPFGAVATCVHVGAFGLTIAQAGDCRLYRYAPEMHDGYEQMTQDHCLQNIAEVQRLNLLFTSGRFVSVDHGSCKRLHYRNLDGSLSGISLDPTRGFGDPEFQPAFTHVPEIRSVNFSVKQEMVFALCSDGGSLVVQNLFKYARANDHVLDAGFLTRLQSTAKMMVPHDLEDDLTIILFRILPTS